MSTPTPPPRRRFKRWHVVGSGMLMLAVIVGWTYRPLNANERWMIGTWVIASFPKSGFTFRTDRTFEEIQPPEIWADTGTWKVQAGKLVVRNNVTFPAAPLWEHVQWRIEEWRREGDVYDLKFEDDGSIRLDKIRYRRIPNP